MHFLEEHVARLVERSKRGSSHLESRGHHNKCNDNDVTPERASGGSVTQLSLRQQVLLAALDCCRGDLQKTSTAEELLLAAWRREPFSWGLRDHELQYPDSEKFLRALDRARPCQGQAMDT